MSLTSPRSRTAEAADRPILARRADYGPWVRRSIVFISCALGLNALIGERGLAETLRARQQLERTAAELTAVRRQNARLVDQIDALSRDPATIELIARDELGMIRKGEVLVLVKDVPQR